MPLFPAVTRKRRGTELLGWVMTLRLYQRMGQVKTKADA
jgi:hypothetical protein